MLRRQGSAPPNAGHGRAIMAADALTEHGVIHADLPIRYRGEQYSGEKRFWRGTQRSIPPDETFERIRPFFRAAGITRVSNITGLDWIGIPVTLAIRPNAKSLTTSSGKGFFLGAAMASGAMEAIELFHAEEVSFSDYRLPYEQLPSTRIPVKDLPLTKYSLFNERFPYTWTNGWDILNQEEVPVPRWMIEMGPDPQHTRDLRSFQVTSNGLASGNTLLEAINSGLFEVIERDAVTCHRVAWDKLGTPPPMVDLNAIELPLVLDLLERLHAAGVRLTLFDCTLDTEVPVYMAYLTDLNVPQTEPTRGYGAHLDPEIAMVRAITEAVQGRCIYIAGSRDDVFRHSYHRMQRHFAQAIAAMDLLPPPTSILPRPNESTPTFEGDTAVALRKLSKAGIRQAIVLDLTKPGWPINVVKVVVPGLEGYLFDFYAPGHRAMSFIESARISAS